MPAVERDGASLYYEASGDAEEVVAFHAEAGLGAWSWGWQHRAVAGPFAALVLDPRGTGRSSADPGNWTAATLAADLEAVLADAGVRRAHLVGCGTGGLVCLAHALEYDRAASLSLLGTPARGAAVDADALATLHGDGRAALEAGLSAAFLDEHPDAVEQLLAWRTEEDADEAVWRAQHRAVADLDLTDRLHEVTVPALVCHGTADRVVPAAAGEALAEGLPRGTWRAFEGTGHLVGVERSRPVNDALVGHLEDAGAGPLS